MVIARDQNRLENFQKINSKDTSSMEDVGKIWYSKIANEVEFFTSPGNHPV
ncbi:hypothetical protein [Sphingobacterium faecium]|uniref:hypothetical protein n=1 Tax=Sphingobacterium faecium TaxID=34087 RepID=UPI001291DB94|nr:hypothetical protein [Sphingobacterium faecium]